MLTGIGQSLTGWMSTSHCEGDEPNFIQTISYSIEGLRNITKLVGIDKSRYSQNIIKVSTMKLNQTDMINCPTFSRIWNQKEICWNPGANCVANRLLSGEIVISYLEFWTLIWFLVSILTQIMFSGQIVVAGKVDRELLPWLNFTVRLLLLIVDVLML